MGFKAPGGGGGALGVGIDISELEDPTVKGDLIVGDGTGGPSALTAGANDTLLIADSGEATGLKWSNTLATIDIDGGTVDGAVIGGAAPANVTSKILSVTPDAITSGGTNDLSFDIAQTLNDPGAAGGNDTYTGIKLDLIQTDVTGWDNLFLMDLQVDSKSIFILDHVNAGITLSDSGVGNFQISTANQNPATDNAGIDLNLQGGAAGSNTTGDVGGSINIIGGAAGGSGNNDGGGFNFIGGAATGSGDSGAFNIIQTGGTPGTDQLTFSHDGADAQLVNLDSAGGFSFLDSTFTEIMFFDGAAVNYTGRMLGNQGADVASANDLTLGADGNVFEITGTTTVNRITNTDWQNGSEITLLFTGALTVADAVATAGSTITILLAGSADFLTAAGDLLKLVLCEIGGTQAWREVSRTANV